MSVDAEQLSHHYALFEREAECPVSANPALFSCEELQNIDISMAILVDRRKLNFFLYSSMKEDEDAGDQEKIDAMGGTQKHRKTLEYFDQLVKLYGLVGNTIKSIMNANTLEEKININAICIVCYCWPKK